MTHPEPRPHHDGPNAPLAVSFTEAAAIRRYTTGRDDFVAVETFLADGPEVGEAFLTLRPAEAFTLGEAAALGAATAAADGALYETTFWPEQPAGALTLSIGAHDGAGTPPLCEIVLDVDKATLALYWVAPPAGAPAATHDIAASAVPEGGIVPASWNLLRVLVTPSTDAATAGVRVRVWFNPQFPDVTGGSVPAEETGTLVPMPPRLDAVLATTHPATAPAPMRLTASNATFRIDYASILPPTLYGLAAELVG